MDELITWLRAQLDDEERVARTATTGPWRYGPDKHWRKPGTVWFEEAVFAGSAGADATCVAGTGETDDPQSMADAEHIARWDPARVLADVEAKRRHIARWEHVNELLADMETPSTIRNELLSVRRAYANAITDDAQPYAGRDGWREEWQLGAPA